MLVAQKVAAGVYKGVTTTELDELAAETAAALTSTHPDYAIVSVNKPLACLGATRCHQPPCRSDTGAALLAAGRAHCSLQPAQVYAEVLLADVSWCMKGGFSTVQTAG